TNVANFVALEGDLAPRRPQTSLRTGQAQKAMSVAHRLRFSCVGSNRFRESISTRPAYSENLDYQIEPGGTLTLMTSDARYGLTRCRVYAVKTL
ncbi:hypothetical protein VQ042_23260, partial [Aurantimonas sp. A2-1-M11]|uniref:hypothetical protein n=1 Tax=Aurantimonas sp. A2-1-M11 TaxID=3113712 RepID=UPI002F958391